RERPPGGGAEAPGRELLRAEGAEAEGRGGDQGRPRPPAEGPAEGPAPQGVDADEQGRPEVDRRRPAERVHEGAGHHAVGAIAAQQGALPGGPCEHLRMTEARP
ncbi:MAG: hypothetical protein ACK559_26260, partial [bacterium]